MIKILIGGSMSIENKRRMSTIVYYTLIALSILSAGFFIYALIVKDVAMWAKIIYFIWAGVVIAVAIFDIFCTTSHRNKFISGIIIYILSILAVIMACILYFMNTGMDGLATDFFNLFISISILSLMNTGYLIASWCVGEALVEHASAEDEIEDEIK